MTDYQDQLLDTLETLGRPARVAEIAMRVHGRIVTTGEWRDMALMLDSLVSRSVCAADRNGRERVYWSRRPTWRRQAYVRAQPIRVREC